MKKILTILLVLILAVFLFRYNTVEVLGFVQENGFAVTGDQLVENLMKEELPVEDMSIELLELRADDKLYSRNGNIYVGEDKIKINKSVPILSKNGNSVSIITNIGSAITRDFYKDEVYPNIIFTDGGMYQAITRQRLNDNQYMLYDMGNDGYYTLEEARVDLKKGANGKIPRGSAVYFGEDFINYYYITGGVLSYGSVNNIQQTDTVYFGSQAYTYGEFYGKLNALKNMEIGNKVEDNKIDEEDLRRSQDEAEQRSQERRTEEQRAADRATATDRVEGSNAGGSNAGGSSAGGSSAGGSSAGGSSAGGAGENDSQNGGAGTGGSGVGSGGVEATGEDRPYTEPTVILVDTDPTVYSVKLAIQAEDKQEVLLYPMEVRILEDDKTVAKKTIGQAGELEEVGGLKPGTSYRIQLTYQFRNKEGKRTKKSIVSNPFSTRPISDLEPVNVKFITGGSTTTSVEIRDIEASVTSEQVKEYLAGVVFTLGNEAEAEVPSPEVKRLIQGEKVDSVWSSETLNSDTEYRVGVKVLDKYKNQMPVNVGSVNVRTAKLKPSTKILTEGSLGKDYKMRLDVKNEDNVVIENLRYKVTSQKQPFTEGTIPLGQKFNLKLDHGATYKVSVYADYDLNNGAGYTRENLIGEQNVKVPSIASYGVLLLENEISNITYNTATVSIRLGKKVNENLLASLDKLRITLIGEERVEEISQRNLDALKRGETIQVNLTDLTPGSRQTLDTQAVTTKTTGEEFIFQSALNNRTFSTFKREADVKVSGFYVKDGKVKYNLLVSDPDDAVVGKEILLIVRNNRGSVVKSDEKKTNEEYVSDEIVGLQDGETYTLEVLTRSYNITSDKVNEERDKTLYSREFRMENSFLQDFDLNRITQASSGYSLDMTVKLSDPENLLPENKFYLEIHSATIVNGEETFQLIEEKTYDFTDADLVDGGDVRSYRKDLTFPATAGRYKYSAYSILEGARVFYGEDMIFTVARTAEGINSQKDLEKIRTMNRRTNYEVVRNIVVNDPDVMGGLETNGIIDFNNHEMELHLDDKSSLFSLVDTEAQILNLHLTIRSLGKSGEHNRAGFTETNRGTIRNVQLTIDGYGVDGNGVQELNKMSGLAEINRGTIERFVVELGGREMILREEGGLLVSRNYGTIRYGYAHGMGQLQAKDESISGRTIGGVVGTNFNIGSMESVYSLIQMREGSINKSDNIGNVVGNNQGTIQRLYSNKAIISNLPSVGPTLGRNQGEASDVYYYAGQGNLSGNAYNTGAKGINLHNESYNEKMYPRDQFDHFINDLETESSYYPHLKNTSTMVFKQKQMAMEKDSSLEEFAIIGLNITDKTDNSATIIVDTANMKGDVIGVSIPDINVGEIKQEVQSQILTQVTVKVTADKHFSSYELGSIKIRDGQQIVDMNFGVAEYVIPLDFYRSIDGLDDWNAHMTEKASYDSTRDKIENFVLGGDIDFAGKLWTEIKKNVIIERLKGDGFKIHGLDIQTMGAAHNQGLIYEVKQSLENVDFVNMKVENLSVKHGIIYYNRGRIENVNFTNIDLQGTKMFNNQDIQSMDDLKNFAENINVWFAYQYGATIGPIIFNDGAIVNVVADNIQIGASFTVGGIVAINNSVEANKALGGSVPHELTNAENNSKSYPQASIVNSTVKNSKIGAAGDSNVIGAQFAGGVVAVSAGDVRSVKVEKSIVMNKFRRSGGAVGQLISPQLLAENLYVDDVLVVGGITVGGVVGRATNTLFSNVGIINSHIYGYWTRVGGVLGIGNDVRMERVYSVDNKVDGAGGIGGIIGAYTSSSTDPDSKSSSISDFYAKNTVTYVPTPQNTNVPNDGTRYSGVGSFAGEVGGRNSKAMRGILGGDLVSKSGGVSMGTIGRIDVNVDLTLSDMLVHTKMENTDVQNTSYLIGNNRGKARNVKIWEGATINDQKKDKEDDSIATEELGKQSTYVDTLRFNSGFWNFEVLPAFFPKLQVGGSELPYQPDISIPTETLGVRIASLPEDFVIPKATVYPSTVSTINVEFDQVTPEVKFRVKDKNNTGVLEEPEERNITDNVYSLNYDYNTPLTIEVVYDDAVLDTYQVDPVLLSNGVTNEAARYAFIAKGRIVKNEDGGETSIAGDFLNINHGVALNKTGEIVDLTSGQVIGVVENVGRVTDTKSILTAAYQSKNIQLFNQFTLVDGQKNNKMLYAKGNQLHILDPQLAYQRNQLIVDRINGEFIETVLGYDGKLYDLKAPLKYPDNFKNRDIKNITNSLNTDNKLILVEYLNGDVIVFNYETGEVAEDRKSEYTIDDPSLLDVMREKLAELLRSMNLETLADSLEGESQRIEGEVANADQIKKALEEAKMDDADYAEGMMMETFVKDSLVEEGVITEFQAQTDLYSVYNPDKQEYEVYGVEALLASGEGEQKEESLNAEIEKKLENTTIRKLALKKYGQATKVNINSIILISLLGLTITALMSILVVKSEKKKKGE